MRRPRRKLEVNTFPFLAVLLCAMGSLIMLLMVMDRRAKIVAQHKARDEYAARKIAQDDDIAAARSAKQDDLQKTWQAQKDALHAKLKVEQETLAQQIAQVIAELAKTNESIQGESSTANNLKTKITLEDSVLRSLQADLVARQTQLERVKQASQSHLKLREQMTQELVLMEAALRSLQERKTQQRPVYSLVPYKGKHGASQKPIYIEVSQGGLAIHPGPTRISTIGFTGPAFARMIEERTGPLEKEVVRPGMPPPKDTKLPYLLFLVRPDGISVYYDAINSLRGYKLDFGYELIEPDWTFDFAPEGIDQQPWRNVASLTVEPANVTKPAPKGMGPRTLGNLGGSDLGPVGNPGGTAGNNPGGGNFVSGQGPGGLPIPPGGSIPGTNGGQQPGLSFANPNGGVANGKGIPGGSGLPGAFPGGTGTGNGGSFGPSTPGGVPGFPRTSVESGEPGVPNFVRVGPGGFPSPAGQGSGSVPGNNSNNLGGSGSSPGGSATLGGFSRQGSSGGPGIPGQATGPGGFPSPAGQSGGVPGSFQGGSANPGGFPTQESFNGSNTPGSVPGQATNPGGVPGSVAFGPGTPGGVPGNGSTTPGSGQGDPRNSGSPNSTPGNFAPNGSPSGLSGSTPPNGNSGPGGEGTPGTVNFGANGGQFRPGNPSNGSGSPGQSGSPGVPSTGGPGPGSTPNNFTPGVTNPNTSGERETANGSSPGTPGEQYSPEEGSGRKPPFMAPKSGGSQGVEQGEPGPRMGNSPFLPTERGPAGPRLPALGRITGNRDFVLTIELFETSAVLSPPGQTYDLTEDQSLEKMATLIRNLVTRRQGTVRPGEPPYRPILRFQVHPDGRRSFYQVYPRLAEFGFPMSRETPD